MPLTPKQLYEIDAMRVLLEAGYTIEEAAALTATSPLDYFRRRATYLDLDTEREREAQLFYSKS